MSERFSVDSPAAGQVVVRLGDGTLALSAAEARRLVADLNRTIRAAELVCDDCGCQNPTVERSGCPLALKLGKPSPATLCQACFERRDREADRL